MQNGFKQTKIAPRPTLETFQPLDAEFETPAKSESAPLKAQRETKFSKLQVYTSA
jgi:hypothetical protein